MTAREKLASAPPSVVCELDDAKVRRFRARTMLIPSPQDVRSHIARIPKGETRTLRELRQSLAEEAGADVTCPFAAGVGWRLVAEAAEESGDEATPWWRVTRDRKPEPRLPGGEARHRALLAAEGVNLP